MKRSWSFSEGQADMKPASLSRGALSLASSDACPSPERPSGLRDSPSESASSRETWPVERIEDTARGLPEQVIKKEIEKKEEDESEQTVVHRVANTDRIQLLDIARENLEILADRMQSLPDECLEELKAELRDILSGAGGPRRREEFAILQKLVQTRRDLTPGALKRANRVQLEILVSIKTGIQAFLHPDISVTQTVLVDIFFYNRCRNMACSSQLPVDDCHCEICSSKTGFCSACMCVICGKFDFDVNTCRWVGCDFCSHWTHTDCAIRARQICMGPSPKKRIGSSEMIFRCRACGNTSELLGWAKDVFKTCACDWDRSGFIKELDSIRRIFHGSDDLNGKRLYQKTEEFLEKLRNGAELGTVLHDMQRLFQEVDVENIIDEEEKGGRGGGGNVEQERRGVVEPEEACSRIAEVVHEVVDKMEGVAVEKAHDLKRARLSLDACDRELDDKRRELGELQVERQRKKQQVEELETIIRLKQAEAEMFQQRADEARHEAEELQRIAMAKSEKVEEEYASRYLKLRLNEAEAERRYLFEKIKLQELSRAHSDPQMHTMCKIQYLLNRACSGGTGKTVDSDQPPSSQQHQQQQQQQQQQPSSGHATP